MTLPTKKNIVLHTAKPPSSQSPKVGWDPFEVWRTRVLLPRLAEEREEKSATAPTPLPLARRTPVAD